MKRPRVVVIGGGASGMMAAGRAGELGCDVTLLEKMRGLGKKLRITGKGRCNLTNMAELEEFIQNYGRNGKFLFNCFSRFFNTDLMRFFEDRDVQLVVERGERVFPRSGDAREIVDCLVGYLKEKDVKIRTNFRVTRIIEEGNRVIGVKGRDDETVKGDAVIVAAGGMSYPHTGSTGDGYVLAQKLGHEIVTPRPGLVPIEIEEEFVKEMQGLSLKNVELTVFADGKRFAKVFGEMLFTHFGLSGPIILTVSRELAAKLDRGAITLSINFKPALARDTLEKRVLREFSENGRMKYKNILKHLLPKKAIPVFIELSGILPDKRGCEIDRTERRRLIELLSDLKLTVRGPRPIAEAIVTKGGVALGEINPKTMESKLIRGLFLCGEVLDVDGNTGGYNLQAAFSTGCAAGEGACGMY